MQHVLSCHPGQQQILADEWLRAYPGHVPQTLGDGWLVVGPLSAVQTRDGLCLAFATQVWPDARDVEAPSIAAWAREIAQYAIEQIEADTPWRIQLFAQTEGDCAVNPRRLALIEAAIWAYLKQKQRRLLKTIQSDMWAPLDGEAHVISAGIFSASRGVVSCVSPDMQQHWRHVFSRFAGGYVPLVDDPRPPARAYRKLREAMAHLDVAPAAGQRWVDLGAAPGSWSYDAVQAGCEVLAIDRSPLREDLMQAANLTFVKTDAFTYRPDAPVDMLVCDVIAYPERNIAFLEKWLSEGLCRGFVVTLKFRGDGDYVKVDACKAVLARLATSYVLRQLYHNKNEVTAAGWRA